MAGPTSTARRWTGTLPILIDSRPKTKPAPALPAIISEWEARYEPSRIPTIRPDGVLGGSATPDPTAADSANIGGSPVIVPTGLGSGAPNPSATLSANLGALELAVIGALILVAVKVL